MNEKKMCLVITGCINPNSNVPVLSIKDGNRRRKEYLDSIQYYIEKTKFKFIVFCDNSQAPKEKKMFELAKQNNKYFEWLSFQGDVDKVIKKGKGFGEIEIINYVVEHSELLKNCESIFKVTGRLLIKNINCFIRLKKESTNYFLIRSNKFVDTRCYCVELSDFRLFFSQSGKDVNDNCGVYLEHIFFKVITENKIKYRNFPIEPYFSGFSGSKGYSYDIPLYKNIVKTVIAFIKS